MRFSRRRFVTMASMLVAALSLPLPAFAERLLSSSSTGPRGRRKMYRLSGRGRRISNAAKRHNAAMRFATAKAADTHRAHPGDRSRIVFETISVEEFQRLFAQRHSLVADLRHVKR